MKFNRKSIVFLVFLILFSFSAESAAAQGEMTQPAELFENFPEIEWEMSAENAKKAIEKTGVRAIRPVETELAWLASFDKQDGRGALRFTGGAGLDEVVVQLYYSDQGKETYEAWLKKLSEKQGKPEDFLTTEDIMSKLWKFKNGFSVELRLLKGEGENRYMTYIHWVKK